MKTVFFQENTNGQRWIDIETNQDGGFDVVFKTQGFAPDGGLYWDVSQDVLGYGFQTEADAVACAVAVAEVYGF